MTPIETFLFLQAMDFLTTLAVFRLGGHELNPFIRLLAVLGPAEGVAISKILVSTLGGLAVWLRRERVFRIINYCFAGIVMWNMMMILRALGYLRG